MNPIWLKQKLQEILSADIGRGDLTTNSIVPPEHHSEAVFLAKEDGILAGLPIAEQVFRLLEPAIEFTPLAKEGDAIHKGQVLAKVQGPTWAILSGERTALNLLQRLSGIASATRKLVDLIQGYKAKVTDTRKTMPGLGILDKYAVRVGGGVNHRMGLDDAVLIKDNHIAVAGSISEAIARVRRSVGFLVNVEVEVETLEQLEEAVAAKADFILLDNMSLDNMKKAVELVGGSIPLEASGNINLETVRDVAATGVDYISSGSLTHSVKAMDISLKISTKTL